MSQNLQRFSPVAAGDVAVVVGAGRSGQAAVRLLCKRGARVRLLEQNADNIPADFLAEMTAAGVSVHTGEHKPEYFAGARFIVPSPGMPVARLRGMLPRDLPPQAEIVAEMELAWRHLQGEPVLAVTGTNGKTTTCSVAAAMLREQGLTVFLGGNIGTPLSEYVLAGRTADVIVVEISSFQLQTCSSFRPRVGVLLNISENHLDYHRDMQEYIDAKFRLFRWQDERDVAVLHESLRPLARQYGLKSRVVWFSGGTQRFADRQLFGAHNDANLEVAWLAVREFGVSQANAAKTVAQFRPLPHRLELVAIKGGVSYVNDSKCTTVTALKTALEAFDKPICLLCGGKFKGGDLQALVPLVTKKVKHVAMFGASREHFTQAWQGQVPLSWDENLDKALARVQGIAAKGDVVLLAPATSSFDLYANYEERGNHFKRLVAAL